MDSDGSGDGAFLHQGIMNSSPSSGLVANTTSDKVSGVTMCSESLLRAPNGLDPFYGSSNWDHLLVSLNQGGNFGDSANEFVNVNVNVNPHSSILLENQALGSSSHLAHIPPHPVLADHMLPKMIPGFGCHPEFANKNWLATQLPSSNISDDHCQDHAQGGTKRKASIENAEDKQQKAPSRDTPEFPKDDDKKKKLGSNVGQKSQSQNKQVKDSDGAEPSKENYIHVRAKRGQATNSHSLAERVRRERISERMRLLQELVPGCNKVTGKAMMLDEIINYVQSLQQQVEFLSMKLATVNPEVNMDIDRILSKEILYFHGSDEGTPVINAGLSSLHRLPGYPFDGAAATTPQFLPPPQHIWNNEPQGILHTGFEPDPSGCSLGLNGLSKTAL